MRRPTLRYRLAALALCASSLSPLISWAQTSPAPAAGDAASPAASPSPDTIIAKVGPDTIRYADLQDAMQTLPDQLRQLPPTMIYPMLLDQLVDRDVIVLAAKKEKLQDDPKVAHAIQRATDMALQNALLSREIQPLLSPEAIQARYDKEYAGKQGDEEVRASHILVATEQEAKDIIAQLKNGADFAELAKKTSTDPSAKENSGELGWFKKADMLPEFSDAAFALKPGEITQEPVHTRFGYHVIKLEERRTAPPPTLDEVRDQIRQQIIQEGVAKVLADAKQGVAIQRFNLDGTPIPDAPATPAPGK
jgi:peptidyl-prolyl cis-trans isomerase C